MSRRDFSLFFLNNVSFVLFLAVFGVFGLLKGEFLQAGNLVNILVQSASTGILATGMTFVLLTAGVDLSVGSIMFAAAAMAGQLFQAGYSVTWGLLAMGGTSLVFGLVNALCITRLRIMAFIVTLATLYVGRGFGSQRPGKSISPIR